MKIILGSTFIGLFVGLFISFFISSLNLATQIRIDHQVIIWLLPLFGLLMIWIDSKFVESSLVGTAEVINKLNETQKKLPMVLAPIVFLGTIFSHLFGASIGREGTALQLSIVIADRISTLYRISAEERRIFLRAGLAAGFAAAVGTPWAGLVFCFEINKSEKDFSSIDLLSCVLSVWIAYGVTLMMRLPHIEYHLNLKQEYLNLEIVLGIIGGGVIFGVFALFFKKTSQEFLKRFKKLFPSNYKRIFIGALLLVLVYKFFSLENYQGLGLDRIQWAFLRYSEFSEPIIKGLLTVVSLGSGFKGGEFTPLVFMGSSLGSAFAGFFSLPLALFAALGFCSVFSGAAKIPFASAVMGAELFGWHIFPSLLLACLIANSVSGADSIYLIRRAPTS